MGQGGFEGAAPRAGDAAQSRLARALRGACGAAWAEDLQLARAEASDALADARARGATLHAAIAQATLAATLGALDDVEGARRHRSSATALLARVPGAPPAERMEALLWLGVADWAALGDVRAARDRFARAAVIAHDDEDAAIAVPALAIRAHASAVAGDLGSAATTAAAAVAAARRAGAPELLALALAADAWQLGARGETAAALAVGDELLALPGHDAGELAALAAWSAAPALLDAGDAARLAELIAPVTSADRLASLAPRTRALLLELRVRVAVARDDGDDARRQLAALQGQAFAQTPLGRAGGCCAAALVALHDDRPANAEALANDAADAAREAPSRLLEIRATVLAGHAQAALAAPDVAAERFAEAEAAARAAGALPLAQEAARQRRALTGERDAWPSAADYGLTVRQLEIARLVASGSTNREVAELLGISDHTVNTHLRAIFRRFGVSRRRELAVALQEAATRDADVSGGAR